MNLGECTKCGSAFDREGAFRTITVFHAFPLREGQKPVERIARECQDLCLACEYADLLLT